MGSLFQPDGFPFKKMHPDQYTAWSEGKLNSSGAEERGGAPPHVELLPGEGEEVASGSRYTAPLVE